jgi:hypothetical protein
MQLRSRTLKKIESELVELYENFSILLSEEVTPFVAKFDAKYPLAPTIAIFMAAQNSKFCQSYDVGHYKNT